MAKQVAQDHVWVVDDDQSMRWVMERALKKSHIKVRVFEAADTVLQALNTTQPHAIISDIRMPGTNGLVFLQKMQVNYPDIPIIIMTAHSDLDSAVSSYQGGAFEYLPKPFDINDAVDLARRACATYRNNIKKQTVITTQVPIEPKEMIGKSPAMQEVFRIIGRLSHSSITVLVTGESGTGKELIAKALHTHSPRVKRAFIALNTAAIPKDLLESELFGHDKGAFTGAYTRRKGRFEQADQGTLFLDEIGDMSAELQTRLLRVLADGEFYRVGGYSPVKVDVRIIAATNQDLEKNVKAGLFREDLFHRLNVIRIHSPALRDRRDDIPLLLHHFMQLSAEELQVEKKIVTTEVIDFLKSLHWAGNVRQLENTCRWLTIMSTGQEIILDDLPAELYKKKSTMTHWHEQLAAYAEQLLLRGTTRILDQLTPMYEKTLIQVALKKTGGRKKEAAELLGWGRNTLTRKLKDSLKSSPKVHKY